MTILTYYAKVIAVSQEPSTSKPHTTINMITASSNIFACGHITHCIDVEQTEGFFKALANSILLAREGKASDLVHKSKIDYVQEGIEGKLQLFHNGALMAITLTKQSNNCQLRGWISGSNLLFLFWNGGLHVDGYSNSGVFEATGNYDQLIELVDKYLAQKMRQFEDDKFVIWI